MSRFLSILLAGLMASVSVLSVFESAEAAPRKTRHHGHYGNVYYRRHNRGSYHRINHRRRIHRRRSHYRYYYRHINRIRPIKIYLPRPGYGRVHHGYRGY
ncbi:hypothetical protein [Cylindrospermum sp. FACHB-282]|uniref:hypothetical protein n=1 Tax=Cylindrospermum sp. FACHB-282 TaxID=2692794 RepID=UPI001682ECBF|nr:hypothetical protein [Cylindrospermum sp. FACHB-282]MBD2384325.1 hypothetical protein [Cylindrospermum sp. FACHB-282]